VCRV